MLESVKTQLQNYFYYDVPSINIIDGRTIASIFRSDSLKSQFFDSNFNPDLILLDEAFSNLDIFLKEEAIKLFFSLYSTRKVPTLVVTHNI